MKESPLPLADNDSLELDAEAVSTSATPVRVRPRRRLVGSEARQRQRRIVRYVMLFVSAAFMINALVGDNGVLATLKAKRKYEDTRLAVNALRIENQRLLEDMNRLKSDPTAIEEAARKDLGLIRPGETLVIIKDKPAR